MVRAAIFVDVPNLLRGKPRPQSESLLHRQLAAIDRCAAALFGVDALTRHAFVLEGLIDPSVELVLAQVGYTVTRCTSDRTRSMDLKRMSRLDDYVLQCSAKEFAREGTPALLIASADRDCEEVAFDLAGTGTRIVFGQWDEPTSRRPGIERVCLRDYDDPKPGSSPSVAVGSNTIELRRREVLVARATLREELTIGRRSRTHGEPDIDLSVLEPGGADVHLYSRRFAQVRRLGETWCLWRLRATDGLLTLPDSSEIVAGACALLLPGETVLRLGVLDAALKVTVSG